MFVPFSVSNPRSVEESQGEFRGEFGKNIYIYAPVLKCWTNVLVRSVKYISSFPSNPLCEITIDKLLYPVWPERRVWRTRRRLVWLKCRLWVLWCMRFMRPFYFLLFAWSKYQNITQGCQFIWLTEQILVVYHCVYFEHFHISLAVPCKLEMCHTVFEWLCEKLCIYDAWSAFSTYKEAS